MTVIRGLVKSKKVLKSQLKKSGPRVKPKGSLRNSNAKCCSESTFGNGLFIQCYVVVTTVEAKCCKVLCSFVKQVAHQFLEGALMWKSPSWYPLLVWLPVTRSSTTYNWYTSAMAVTNLQVCVFHYCNRACPWGHAFADNSCI